MKTIVHIETTDEERNKLYIVWNENSPSKKMVSRADVTARVLTHIEEEIAQHESQPVRPADETLPEPVSVEPEKSGGRCIPGQLQDDEFTMPTAAELAAACSTVLEHIALNKEDDTINVGWCISIIAATGAI